VLADALPFLPAEWIERVPSLALPIVLLAFGFAFLGYSEHAFATAFVARTPAAAPKPPIAAPPALAAAPSVMHKTAADSLPKPPQPPVDYTAALGDVLAIIAVGGQIPAQKFLSRRWGGKSEATVSKWLFRMKRDGHIVRRRDGKARDVRAA